MSCIDKNEKFGRPVVHVQVYGCDHWTIYFCKENYIDKKNHIKIISKIKCILKYKTYTLKP